MFCGALAYADDVVLLAPSRSSLRNMLRVAAACAEQLSLRFNGEKSQYLLLESQPTEFRSANIPFCGVDVPRVERALHLGNVVGSGWMQKSIARSVADLNQRTNVLMSRFGFCPPDVRYKLFKSHCMIAYGCQLWDFDSEEVNKFFTAWRVNVRKIWGLPRATHCDLLPGVCSDRSAEMQLLSRALGFIKSAVESKNAVVRRCAGLAIGGSRSSVSGTVRHIADHFNVLHECVHEFRLPRLYTFNFLGSVARDLAISCHYSHGDERDEYNTVLAVVCTK